MERLPTQPKTDSVSEDASPGTRSAKRKRFQVRKACMNCRSAHLACTLERPCRRCVDAGISDMCSDAPRRPRQKSVARVEEHMQNKMGMHSHNVVSMSSQIHPLPISPMPMPSPLNFGSGMHSGTSQMALAGPPPGLAGMDHDEDLHGPISGGNASGAVGLNSPASILSGNMGTPMNVPQGVPIYGRIAPTSIPAGSVRGGLSRPISLALTGPSMTGISMSPVGMQSIAGRGPSFVVIEPSESRIVECNPRFMELCGLLPEMIPNMKLNDVLSSHEHPNHAHIVREMIQGRMEICNRTFLYRCRGSDRPVQCVYSASRSPSNLCEFISIVLSEGVSADDLIDRIYRTTSL